MLWCLRCAGRGVVVVAVVAGAGFLAGRAASSPTRADSFGETKSVAHSAGASGLSGSAALTRWLVYDRRRRAVTLTVIAGYNGAYNGFNFNGYSKGRMLVEIPKGWRVTVRCSNRGALAHSCAVVKSVSAGVPAFPGAASPKPAVGLEQGQSVSFAFTASRVGGYRIVCLVPGHEQAGMWDVFEVGSTPLPSIGLLR